MQSHRYSDRANSRHRRPPSYPVEERPFQHKPFLRYPANARCMPTYRLTADAVRTQCAYRPWLPENSDSAHLSRQSPLGPYRECNPEPEPKAERDDDALVASLKSFSTADAQNPLTINDGGHAAIESESNWRQYGELSSWEFRRSWLRTVLPLPIRMVLGNGNDKDDFADDDFDTDVDDDDDYDSEEHGEYGQDGDSPGGSRAWSDYTSYDKNEGHSRRGLISDFENLFRERKITDRDSAAARILIGLGGSVPARSGQLRQGWRADEIDTVHVADDKDEGNGIGEMETDSLSYRLVQASSFDRIGAWSGRRHSDYTFVTEPRYRRRIANDGCTVAEDELAQLAIYENFRQSRLNRFSRESTGRGRREGQSQVLMGRNERQPALFPASNEENWSDLMPTESETRGAGVDVNDKDVLSEAPSTTGHSPARAQSTVTASGQDVERRGQQSSRGSRRQSACLRPGQGLFWRRQRASKPEHEPEAKDEDRNENDEQEEEEGEEEGRKEEEKVEKVEENDKDEDRQDEEREDSNDDNEKIRNSRNAQSDSDIDIDDTLVATPAPPSNASLEYLIAEPGSENESENPTEEMRSQREISGSSSPFPVPPQTPGSEPNCSFSYPRPCTAMEPGEHPYPRKVISHIFGRNKKVTKQIPPWIWVYYCRRHYQRSRYRAGTDGREWARIQCEKVLDLFEAMRKWGMVEGFTVHLRSREVERLAGAARASAAAAPSPCNSKWRGGRRERRATRARRGGRVRTRRWSPGYEEGNDDREPGQGTGQERPSVPSPVPNWLVTWIQRFEGEVIPVEEAEALIRRILAHINVVQAEEVRFPDIEILPVFKEGWPPTTAHRSPDSGRSVRRRARFAPAASSPGAAGRARRGAVPARDSNYNSERPSKRRRMCAGNAAGPRND
ncbi:hypothetical protein BDW66DRAFT_147401 [Aspergillus desertorum]